MAVVIAKNAILKNERHNHPEWYESTTNDSVVLLLMSCTSLLQYKRTRHFEQRVLPSHSSFLGLKLNPHQSFSTTGTSQHPMSQARR
jgi:hypothetical protein